MTPPRPFEAAVPGGVLAGWMSGAGAPVLLLHGGPGLTDYTEGLAEELASDYTVYRYQQRGLAPSTTAGPFTIETHVMDVVAVLDALGLDKVWLVGHSWGGHLVLHLAVMHPERVFGVLSVDPLGAVGDGGESDLSANLGARLLPEAKERMDLLDQRALAGLGSSADAIEMVRLAWPGYFPDPAAAPPMPDLDMSVDCYAQTFESIRTHLAATTLETGLPLVRLPIAFILGAQSPIPTVHGYRTAALVPGSVVHEFDGCGHMVWLDRPGDTVRILTELVGSA
jgi:pimeloyl-ACP methyl ester carboxylesterase